MNPFIMAALSLAELAPAITRWFHPSSDKGAVTQMIAGQLVDIAKRVTGSKDTPTAVNRLQSDQALLIQFQQLVEKLDYDLEKTFVEDRMNARARDAAMATTGENNIRADIMVFSAALGLVGCLVSLVIFQKSLPGEAVGILSTIAGIFGSCLKDAYAFEFGSSRGSKNKDLTVLMQHMR